MTEPKTINYKKSDYLQSTLDRAQWQSNLRAIQNFEAKMDEIHAELRKADVTKEKLADLPNQQDFFTRLRRHVEAN